MIGPYSPFAWAGYVICNVGIPIMRGTDGESLWLTLMFAPLWGLVFVMAYRKELREGGQHRLLHFVLFNALLALPAVLASYWIGTLVG